MFFSKIKKKLRGNQKQIITFALPDKQKTTAI